MLINLFTEKMRKYVQLLCEDSGVFQNHGYHIRNNNALILQNYWELYKATYMYVTHAWLYNLIMWNGS